MCSRCPADGPEGTLCQMYCVACEHELLHQFHLQRVMGGRRRALEATVHAEIAARLRSTQVGRSIARAPVASCRLRSAGLHVAGCRFAECNSECGATQAGFYISIQVGAFAFTVHVHKAKTLSLPVQQKILNYLGFMLTVSDVRGRVALVFVPKLLT